MTTYTGNNYERGSFGRWIRKQPPRKQIYSKKVVRSTKKWKVFNNVTELICYDVKIVNGAEQFTLTFGRHRYGVCDDVPYGSTYFEKIYTFYRRGNLWRQRGIKQWMFSRRELDQLRYRVYHDTAKCYVGFYLIMCEILPQDLVGEITHRMLPFWLESCLVMKKPKRSLVH